MSGVDDVRNDNAVTIFLGGKDRHVILDLNALALIEEKLGDIQKAFNKMQEGSMKDIRTILWAGLLHDETTFDDDGNMIAPKLSEMQVGHWITMDIFQDVSNALTKAMFKSMPEVDVSKLPPEVRKMLDPTLTDAQIAATDDPVARKNLQTGPSPNSNQENPQ